MSCDSAQAARNSASIRRRRGSPAGAAQVARSASSGGNGCVAGGAIGMPERRALRATFSIIQRAFGATSAGPSWPCAFRSPANRTGTGSTARPQRAASGSSCDPRQVRVVRDVVEEEADRRARSPASVPVRAGLRYDRRAMKFVSALGESAAVGAALDQVMPEIDAGLGGAPDLAFVFASGRCADGGERMLARLERAWPDAVVVGCSARSVIGGGREVEEKSSLAARRGDAARCRARAVRARRLPERAAELADSRRTPRGSCSPTRSASTPSARSPRWAAPRAAARSWAGSRRAAPRPGHHSLFVGGRVRRSGCVGVALSGALEVVSSVAQGCRPIGQPMFVTSGRENLIGALDGRPPLEVLQAVFAASPPEDQALFHGSLFLGVAMREGESSYAQGDFLVRNIAGVTAERSELAVDAPVHEGQVVQFHLRDPRTAERDLELALARLERSGGGAPRGALLFSCLGRGSALYGAPNRESECFRARLRRRPARRLLLQRRDRPGRPAQLPARLHRRVLPLQGADWQGSGARRTTRGSSSSSESTGAGSRHTMFRSTSGNCHSSEMPP